jgi:hypothetical protein
MFERQSPTDQVREDARGRLNRDTGSGASMPRPALMPVVLASLKSTRRCAALRGVLARIQNDANAGHHEQPTRVTASGSQQASNAPRVEVEKPSRPPSFSLLPNAARFTHRPSRRPSDRKGARWTKPHALVGHAELSAKDGLANTARGGKEPPFALAPSTPTSCANATTTARVASTCRRRSHAPIARQNENGPRGNPRSPWFRRIVRAIVRRHARCAWLIN